MQWTHNFLVQVARRTRSTVSNLWHLPNGVSWIQGIFLFILNNRYNIIVKQINNHDKSKKQNRIYRERSIMEETNYCEHFNEQLYNRTSSFLMSDFEKSEFRWVGFFLFYEFFLSLHGRRFRWEWLFCGAGYELNLEAYIWNKDVFIITCIVLL